MSNCKIRKFQNTLDYTKILDIINGFPCNESTRKLNNNFRIIKEFIENNQGGGGNDTYVVIRDNGDGTYTGVNVDGSEVTWAGDTFITFQDNGNDTYTFVAPNGDTMTLCAPCPLPEVSAEVCDTPLETIISDYSRPTVDGMTFPAGGLTYEITDGTTVLSQTGNVNDTFIFDTSSLAPDVEWTVSGALQAEVCDKTVEATANLRYTR